ncbi:MAG: hypothetical protein JSS07_07165 [Proteobacteria bacterium]|nr:hypothetical protein [Pseudomonadota bacterium]
MIEGVDNEQQPTWIDDVERLQDYEAELNQLTSKLNQNPLTNVDVIVQTVLSQPNTHCLVKYTPENGSFVTRSKNEDELYFAPSLTS